MTKTLPSPASILTSVLLCVAISGCAVSQGDDVAPGIDSEQQSIIGGRNAPFDDAVVMLNIGCTGTLIRPNVVLTAAHCLPAGSVFFGPQQGEFFASRRVVDSFQSRHYDSGLFAGGDLALLRLESDAPPDIEPLPFNNVVTLTSEEHKGVALRVVGFGNTDGIANTGFGTRRQVDQELLGINGEFIVTGTETANTCQGDSGGPTFMKIDGVEHVIAVTSFGAPGCLGTTHQTRVDWFIDEFVTEVLDAWSSVCRTDGNCVTDCPGFADPDCDLCGLDGICSTGCAKKDLDCPLSGALGDSCSGRESCESLTCVVAKDDGRVSICSEECDPTSATPGFGCELPLSSCVQADDGAYYCQYSKATPSTQGAACNSADDCRSGLCDTSDRICVEACGGDLPACADGYSCGSMGNGQSACLLPNGGGCNAANAGGGPGESSGLLLLGIAALLLVRRRRAVAG